MIEMIRRTVDRMFGETSAQKVKRLQNHLEAVNALAAEVGALSDEALQAKTPEFRERLEGDETLDDLLPEAYAVVREVAERTLGLRPYDVQVLGGVVLHQRRIAEMKTGEGKTLVATLPAYLNALAGRVHIITVNDYLAKRDREWMGPVYDFLGVSVGLLQENAEQQERQAAYACDIIYGTNTQFGFDYLRDNLVSSKAQKVQGPLDFAIVDEIDNILIDEARTPLIISGSTQQTAQLYKQFSRLAGKFDPGTDFEVDEKAKRVTLVDEGISKIEKLLKVENIYEPNNIELLHHLELCLRARLFYHKDHEYIVKDGQIVIVDEFTGRLMPDRRWSDGLHQAVEAKEGLNIRRENQTLATITLQHYFRLYQGLSGMTGTAVTEEDEFKEIYNLDVVAIPTNRPLIREDKPDVMFRTEAALFKALVDEIEALNASGRPVLIGTNSIDKSERLSQAFKRRGLEHEVLNAKQHEREAQIIVDAGQRGAITVATNMAGRGVDIKLEEGVEALGGLAILGTQRHESRRIDDQLRGRAGRQGDAGSSQFFISLEDELIRLFGGERLGQIMDRFGMKEGDSIEHPMLSKAVRNAQKKVEARNFDIRKNLLKYDRVMAKQREAIYALRDRFLVDAEGGQDDLQTYLGELVSDVAASLVEEACASDLVEEWNLKGVQAELNSFQNAPPIRVTDTTEEPAVLQEKVENFLLQNLNNQIDNLGEHFNVLGRLMILSSLDERWRMHLYALDDLREGIGWRSYAGRDPLVEFTRESFSLFQDMLRDVQTNLVNILVKPKLHVERAADASAQQAQKLQLVHEEASVLGGDGAPAKKEPARVGLAVGRNDLCPCGSGKKFKRCHMGRESELSNSAK